ncbi:MAG: endonuclease [Saprospiraceae bacterium]|nr:endonuclease [Saprospiraceae bacterium]
MISQKASLILLLVSTLMWSQTVNGQYQQQKLFPTDSGYLLIQKLVSSFKPATVLDYANARVKMYTEIYNIKDTVECVYTKHALYLDPQYSDPIGYLSKNGNDNGINCEHTFPQSKGAENGNAKSDMHHLFPSRAAVNEARSNYPFGEIDDPKTNKWFYKSISQSFVPGTNKNEFSESISGLFEPREDHKGNVARAIFYFFTMYELQADVSFFENMKPILCSWHLQDPVDSLEWNRSQQIAQFQDQKPNPFVLDCSLARRCYCAANAECFPVTHVSTSESAEQIIYPNPFQQNLYLNSNISKQELNIQLFDLNGQLKFERNIESQLHAKAELPLADLPKGYYTLVLSHRHQVFQRIRVLKF